MNQTFELDGDALDWTITLENATDRWIEIGELAVPFQFAERTGARGDIYTRKLLRHAYVAGHGSWVDWQRAGGEGPYLVMTPIGATKFEYYDRGERRSVEHPFTLENRAGRAHQTSLTLRGLRRGD